MQENLTINIQFSRDQVATVATLAGTKIDEDTWNALSQRSVSVSLDDIDDREVQLAFLITIVGIAINKTL